MKIAIIKLSALGDIIHALVAVQFIKAEFKSIKIDWIVEQRFAEILHNNPDINQILTVNLQSIKKNKLNFFSELQKIRNYAHNNYELVIDAQSLIKSAIIAKLVSTNVAGFDSTSCRENLASLFYDTKFNCAYDEKTIDRNALILSKPLGFKISGTQIINKKPFLYFNNEDKKIYPYFKSKNIVFIIGSGWESRNYPKQKFLKIAEALQENCLVVWGTEDEKVKADWLQQRAKNIQVMPKMDINTLKAVIKKSDLLIGNDTGPTHMAWALNRPSITIFGPTPVSRVYQTEINKVVKSKSKVNPLKLNKHDYSIQDIDENEIIKISKALI
jgi:heptosyltransferase-1